MDALQTQYDAAERVNMFAECARLDKALAAADAESATLSLAVRDYQTLSDRHDRYATLLHSQCIQKVQAQEVDALEPIAQVLKSLKELDAAALVFPLSVGDTTGRYYKHCRNNLYCSCMHRALVLSLGCRVLADCTDRDAVAQLRLSTMPQRKPSSLRRSPGR